MKSIYLDNSATTRISEAALNKYVDVSREIYGNPSSLHAEGFRAEREINAVRATLLDALRAKDASVIFTASGSEANNLAILGRALAKERFRRGGKIITTDGEHASVILPEDELIKMGFKVVKISTRNGVFDIKQLEAELDGSVILISMMMVNNETGALYPTAQVASLMRMRSPDAVLHVDATQSFMKLPFTKASSGADMITVSAHKIHGPKGVGALIIDNKIIKNSGIRPIVLGGGQEGGLRSGTENVPAIAAFGVAIAEAKDRLQKSYTDISSLREYLIERLTAELPEISLTLPEAHAPHILNITLPSIKSETMLHYLSSKGIFVSSGSACSSNGGKVSSALLAYGRSADEADNSVRISLSYENTREDIDALIAALTEGIQTLARKR